MKHTLINEYNIFTNIYLKITKPFLHLHKHAKKIIFDNTIQYITEERTLYRYTINKPPFHGYNPVHDGHDLSIIERHFNEKKIYLERKEMTNTEIYKNLNKIKSHFIHLINHPTKSNKPYFTIKKHKDSLQFENITFPLDSRLKYLVKLSNIEHVMAMLFRYTCFGITGQHCSLPFNVYKHLYDEYNVRGECFASPLNSKLITLKDTFFCTLFKDIDAVFGSKGPFNYKIIVDNQDVNMFINPPYMTNIIEWTEMEIMRAFDETTNEKLLLIVLIPKREENIFKNNKYLIDLIEPDVGKHYMDCNGNMTHMEKIINSMFFLSKYKHKINKNKILEVWNMTEENEKEQQSAFTGPIF